MVEARIFWDATLPGLTVRERISAYDAMHETVAALHRTDHRAFGLDDYARTRIAAFKLPKQIDFVAALPRGPSGKVRRRALRDPFWAGRTRHVN